MRASSLNRADRYVIEGIPLPMRLMLGLFRPRQRQLGMDFSGEVLQLGSRVTDFRVGDAVYGQQDLGKAWAEYVCVPASVVAPKPENLSHVQAAAVPLAGLTALQGLRDAAELKPGQSILINGATGAVGTFAVQIAKALGAEVAAVCGARNVALVEQLGADVVIPYETEDFLACGRTFDVIFDIVGNRSLLACRKVMKRKATFVPVGGPSGFWFGPVWALLSANVLGLFLSQRVRSFVGTPNRADLVELAALIESGDVTPAVDREFELAELPEAMRYLVHGRPNAKVAIRVDHGEEADVVPD